MTTKAVACTVQAVDASGNAVITNARNGTGGSPATAAAVEAAVVVLEGDAASPTQGHVNSLRTVWDTLAGAIGGQIQLSADCIIIYNTATVASRNTLKQAVHHLIDQLPLAL